MRTVFLAPTVASGAYWASQWGFTGRDAAILTPDHPERARGLRPERVFVVSGHPDSYRLEDELLPYFRVSGTPEFIFAEDLR